jgi:Raf kinase inhibitor-like YbhB/YbcL family protein
MRRALPVLVAVGALLAGCGDSGEKGAALPGAPAAMRLTSPAFRDGQPIPARFTCDGAGVSPPLTWSSSPHGAQELALVVEDVDADRFLHWTVLGIAPTTGGLRAGQVPDGAVQTENGFGDHGWGGPCPPEGDDPHRYLFSVYALDARLGLDDGASPADVADAIGDHALARGTLTGTYERNG